MITIASKVKLLLRDEALAIKTTVKTTDKSIVPLFMAFMDKYASEHQLTSRSFISKFTDILKAANQINDRSNKRKKLISINNYRNTYYGETGSTLLSFQYSVDYGKALGTFMRLIEVPVPPITQYNQKNTHKLSYSMFYRIKSLVTSVPLALAGLSASVIISKLGELEAVGQVVSTEDASSFMKTFCMKPKTIFYVCVDDNGNLVKRLVAISDTDTTDDDIGSCDSSSGSSTGGIDSTIGTPSSVTLPSQTGDSTDKVNLAIGIIHGMDVEQLEQIRIILGMDVEQLEQVKEKVSKAMEEKKNCDEEGARELARSLSSNGSDSTRELVPLAPLLSSNSS